jgi:3-phenylpropionate/cinnamic acid dioxygenase small subunit
MSDQAHRLALAADRSEIVDLIARIAQLADNGTPEDYVNCFADQPVWELAAAQGLPIDPQIIRGRAAILAAVFDRRASNMQGPGSHTVHAVQRTTVIVDGDVARAESLFVYYTHSDQTPKIAAMGQYDDTLLRQSERWLLAKRTIRRD